VIGELGVIARMVERRGQWTFDGYFDLPPELQAFWLDREVAIIEGRDQPEPTGRK